MDCVRCKFVPLQSVPRINSSTTPNKITNNTGSTVAVNTMGEERKKNSEKNQLHSKQMLLTSTTLSLFSFDQVNDDLIMEWLRVMIVLLCVDKHLAGKKFPRSYLA